MGGDVLTFLPPVLPTPLLSASTLGAQLWNHGNMLFLHAKAAPIPILGTLVLLLFMSILHLRLSSPPVITELSSTSANRHPVTPTLNLNDAPPSGRQVPQHFLEDGHILAVSISPQSCHGLVLWGAGPTAAERVLVMCLLVMSCDTIRCRYGSSPYSHSAEFYTTGHTLFLEKLSSNFPPISLADAASSPWLAWCSLALLFPEALTLYL